MLGVRIPPGLPQSSIIQASGNRADMFQRLVKFIKEVRNELKRVSWPSRDEIRGSTVVVIVIVIVLAVFIGLVDRALSFAISLIFG
jgi:preprotein translocase subunit SecE